MVGWMGCDVFKQQLTLMTNIITIHFLQKKRNSVCTTVGLQFNKMTHRIQYTKG
jgi:hypothetical protein